MSNWFGLAGLLLMGWCSLLFVRESVTTMSSYFRAGSDLLSSPFPQHRISFAFFSTFYFLLSSFFLAPNHEKRAAFSGFPRKKTQQVKNTRKKRGEPARRGTNKTRNTRSDDADERTRRSKRLRTYDCTGTDIGRGNKSSGGSFRSVE